MKPRLLFIVGPTAVGKTDIAFMVAQKMGAEIISCDSMQIYKGMDIIASIPLGNMRQKVRHHLVAFLKPSQDYDVARYRQAAVKKMKEVLGRGKVPLFVGGSGHYMSVLLDGIFKAGSPDEKVRAKLYAKADSLGSAYLHRRLEGLDPEAASKIHPNDAKRIVRALEVFEVTGKPISLLQKQRRGLADNYDIKIFCLNMERARLYQRIEDRVDKMFELGLEDEVKKLLELKLSKTAACAIGLRELKGYFDGLYDLGGAKSLIKKNTRNYAKRQLTWFRKDKRIEWIEIGDKETARENAKKIISRFIKTGDSSILTS